jgi:isopenicillin N synthase-like dioxygenase
MMTTKTERTVSPDLELPTSKIIDDKLIFDDPTQMELALKAGAFYLEVPSHVDVHWGIQLAQNFYKDLKGEMPGYTGYKQRSFEKTTLGYADRPDQVEQFQLELPLWNNYFPKEVCDLLYAMNLMSIQVMRNLLEYVDIPQKDWDIITNGSFENNAGHNTTINHYRTEKHATGLVGHKDSGYITLLYANLPGYEVMLDYEWYSVPPKDKYFIVNLGHVLEILTENLNQPMIASYHRVRQLHYDEITEDRISFTTFITPRYDGHIYQYDKNGSLQIYREYIAFLKERFRKVNYYNHRGLDKDTSSSQVKNIASLYEE